MVNSISSSLASTLFGSTSTDAYGVSADLLTSWALAKAGVTTTAVTTPTDPNAPLAPVWNPGLTPAADKLVSTALAGKSFFDTNTELYSALGATGDYKRLFALHTGIATLQALATKLQDDTITASERSKLTTQFNRGVQEMQNFFGAQAFEDIRMVAGDRVDDAQTTLAIPSTSEDYQTPVIHKGSLADVVTGLDKNAQFDIVATTPGGTQRTVSIDLSQMGSIPRSLGNVVSFVNNKLTAAGAASRLEAVNMTPKTTTVMIAGVPTQQAYVGSRQYALKVDVRAGETITFAPQNTTPAFYIAGATASGAHLVKLSDVSAAASQPQLLDRPDATVDPIGADVAAGWLATASSNAMETRTNALVSDSPNNYEDKLRDAGEATLKVKLADGTTVSVTTAWQSDDIEKWRQGGGETEDQGILNDLAQRFTQLLHEQGVAAGVEVWQDTDGAGFSIKSADTVAPVSLGISGKATTLTQIDPPGMVGGLRDGVFARRFETQSIGASNTVFIGDQTFTFTTQSAAQTITIHAGGIGIDAATMEARLNTELKNRNVAAHAAIVDSGGQLSLQVDALHEMLDVSAVINKSGFDADLAAPGAWANGGLPVSAPGGPYTGAIRTYDVAGGSPLSAYAGAVNLSIVVQTPSGAKTINVAVSATERANDPDPSPGHWSQTFQDRLNTALNQAGVYVGAVGDDLSQWQVAEDTGARISSISINGDALTLNTEQPAQALGGAFSVERSFTSAPAATATGDPIAALATDQTVSITFGTAWGQKTVSATLDPLDPQTLDSVAARLNEALSAAGYDLGVEAVDLSGGGSGLRAVTGSSHTVSTVTDVTIGGQSSDMTLDAIDAQTHASDPVGTAAVADRASRGAAIVVQAPIPSSFVAPSANTTAWFAGRAFDVTIGGGMQVATARDVATGPDGSVFVLADLGGDADGAPIKGSRDVALFKYDSAGNLAYSRVLGASDSASGFALAVSNDGKVAIAGSVTGALGATQDKGGADSFVTVFDGAGKELWTARRGASGDDQVNALSFASDGTLVVAGKTVSALGPALALGGADAYVRAYSSSGGELFTKQFGSGGDDTATALLVTGTSASGLSITTGGVENNRGVLRSFSYSSSAGVAVGATRDIGNFYKSAINALATDGVSLFVGGEVGAGRVNVGSTAQGAVAGQEGFVARMDMNLAVSGNDRTTYIGSAQDDAVSGLAVVSGQVYAVGTAGGVVAGQGTANAKSSFITRLDADGEIGWARTFTTGNGAMSGVSLAVDATGASALDVLGLPTGKIGTTDSTALVDRSALNIDDEFKIGVDGKRLSTITIAKTDTTSTLLAKLNRVLGSSGRAEIVKDDDGASRIHLVASDGHAIQLSSGRAGRDALSGLGLHEGVIAKNSTARNAKQNYGLGLLPGDLQVTSAAAITKAKAELAAADSIVRRAYDALVTPNKPEQTDIEKKLAAAQSQAVPEYLSAQIANYQAALARLGG